MKAAKVITNIATYFIISSQTFSFLPCFIHLSCATICLTAIQNTHPTKISIVPIGILSGLVAINRKFSRPEFSMFRPYRISNTAYYIYRQKIEAILFVFFLVFLFLSTFFAISFIIITSTFTQGGVKI